MRKTSKSQLEATKRYLEGKDVLKITFDKGTRDCLDAMLPYAKQYYNTKFYIRSVQDFIRFSIICAMEEITLYYGEVVADPEVDGLSIASFPDADNPKFIVECSADYEEKKLFAINSYVVDKKELEDLENK